MGNKGKRAVSEIEAGSTNEKKLVKTVMFDNKSKDGIKAYDFLDRFKRKQGKFLTQLILWYIDHSDTLCYDEKLDKILELSTIAKPIAEMGIDAQTISSLNKMNKALDELGIDVNTFMAAINGPSYNNQSQGINQNVEKSTTGLGNSSENRTALPEITSEKPIDSDNESNRNINPDEKASGISKNTDKRASESADEKNDDSIEMTSENEYEATDNYKEVSDEDVNLVSQMSSMS